MIPCIQHVVDATLLKSPERTIRVWLPEDYDVSMNRRYPVLYMQDGENLADPAWGSGYSWNAPHQIHQAVRDGLIEPIVLVGIDNGKDNRIPEYTCAVSPKAYRGVKRYMKREWTPMGEDYGTFLLQVVKPLIDATYRTIPTKDGTGIAGSSCGANISLDLLARHPEVFGVVGAFSPAYWIVEAPLREKLMSANLDSSTRIYHDMGGKERKWLPIRDLFPAHRFHRLMKELGWTDETLKFVIDPNATHTELFWQSRFLGFLRFAYRKDLK